MAHRWDPEHYLAYAGERGRPFVELLARIPAEAPRRVVDLGCGPATLTTLLAQRWPDADVRGVDSSPEMVEAAQAAGMRVELGDVRDWAPDEPVDVLISNATLQWVPDHLALLPRLLSHVTPGGWLAFQVPGNFDEPTHALRREIARHPRYASHLEGVAEPRAHDPQVYLEALVDLGCAVDAWETTYLHVLAGDHAAFEWTTGTGAKPMLDALPEMLRTEFAEELRAALAAAYPQRSWGTLMPFRRVFVVAQAPA